MPPRHWIIKSVFHGPPVTVIQVWLIISPCQTGAAWLHICYHDNNWIRCSMDTHRRGYFHKQKSCQWNHHATSWILYECEILLFQGLCVQNRRVLQSRIAAVDLITTMFQCYPRVSPNWCMPMINIQYYTVQKLCSKLWSNKKGRSILA